MIARTVIKMNNDILLFWDPYFYRLSPNTMVTNKAGEKAEADETKEDEGDNQPRFDSEEHLTHQLDNYTYVLRILNTCIRRRSSLYSDIDSEVITLCIMLSARMMDKHDRCGTGSYRLVIVLS